MKPLSRRTLLRGLLGGAVVSIGLPPLERFMNVNGTAYADEGGGPSGFPSRFGLIFWGNGVQPERWVPELTGQGDAWALSEQLAPLQSVKSYLTVVSGTRVNVTNVSAHSATLAGMLTAAPLLDIPGVGHRIQAPTIDQRIAAAIGGETARASIEFGVYTDGSLGESHAAPSDANPAAIPRPAEFNPAALFSDLFGANFILPGSGDGPPPTLGVERSVLDAVMGQIAGVQGQLGAGDKARLEAHFEGIRSIERRLQKLQENPPNLAACAAPPVPLGTADAHGYPPIEGRPQLVEINAVMSDMAAMALACDQTRVFSNWMTNPVANPLMAGSTDGHHSLTHDEPGEQPQVNAIVKELMGMVATQLDALAAVEEGDGTLLDHCAVLCTSEVSRGRTHSPDDFPILLAGGCNGYLKTDMHWRSEASDSTSKVLLTLCQAMGMPVDALGIDDCYTTESLTEVEA
ncbi:MAG: DUF1552 domain-containing protein [Myxococcota bacterium]